MQTAHVLADSHRDATFRETVKRFDGELFLRFYSSLVNHTRVAFRIHDLILVDDEGEF